jgi:hypothetical protein
MPAWSFSEFLMMRSSNSTASCSRLSSCAVSSGGVTLLDGAEEDHLSLDPSSGTAAGLVDVCMTRTRTLVSRGARRPCAPGEILHRCPSGGRLSCSLPHVTVQPGKRTVPPKTTKTGCLLLQTDRLYSIGRPCCVHVQESIFLTFLRRGCVWTLRTVNLPSLHSSAPSAPNPD